MIYSLNRFKRCIGFIIFLCLVLFSIQPVAAQRSDANWFPYLFQFSGPIPSGPSVSTIDLNGNIYVAGNSGIDVRVAKWDGTVWHVLGDKFSSTNFFQAEALAITVDSNEDVYLGGLFDIVYNASGTSDSVSNIAKFDATTNSWEPVGQGVDNGVSALVVDPGTNNIYVGGGFNTGTNSAGGMVTLSGIGRWNITTEVWEKLGEGVTTIGGFSGGVYDAAVESNGNLIIVGNFDKAYQTGGIVDTVNGIARWNITTSLWEKFGNGVTPLYSIVNNIALDTNDDLYVAGNFQFAINPGGTQVTGPVVKWDGSQWESRSIATPEIFSIGVDGTDILYCLAQEFGGPKTFLHRWALGQWEIIADLQFEGASTTATDLSNAAEYLYLGGRYSEIINLISGDTTAAINHAEWDGSDWTALNLPIGANGDIHAIQSDWSLDYLYIGGDFSAMNGIPFNHIARIDGNLWEGLGFGLNGPVYEIHAENNFQFSKDVFVGGNFDFATNSNGSSVALNNIGRWNATLEQWERFGFGVNGPVYAIQFVYDHSGAPEYLYIGGQFDIATNPDNSTVTNLGNIVRWSFDLNVWQRLGDGITGGTAPIVYTIEGIRTPIPDIYIGGSFTAATNPGGGQVNSPNIVRLNRFTNEWEAIGQGVDSAVYAIQYAKDGGNYWVGGKFNSATNSNGVMITTPNLVIWDQNFEFWDPVGQLNGAVKAIETPLRGKTYFGGDFTMAGSLPVNHIALREGLLFNFSEGWSTLGSGTNNTINAIDFIQPCYKSGEILYVGGNFTVAGSQPTNYLAKWKFAWKNPLYFVHGSSGSTGSTGYRGTVTAASCSGLSQKMADFIIFNGLKFRESAIADSLPLFELFELKIAPSNDPFNPIVTFDSLSLDSENPHAMFFTGVDDTVLFAPNPDGRSTGFSILTEEMRRELIQPGQVELLIANTVTDAPAIDIEAQGVGSLIENLIYSETADSIAIAPGMYTFDVKRNSDGQLLGSYPVDISNNEGEIVLVLVSGFLDPAANQNGPPMSLDAIETDIIVSIEPQNIASNVVETFRLSQNYPNPFNPETIIDFYLPTNFLRKVKLTIYNILGQEVQILVNTNLMAGSHKVIWDGYNNYGEKVASGIYLYRLQAGDYVETRKMVLMK